LFETEYSRLIWQIGRVSDEGYLPMHQSMVNWLSPSPEYNTVRDEQQGRWTSEPGTGRTAMAKATLHHCHGSDLFSIVQLCNVQCTDVIAVSGVMFNDVSQYAGSSIG